MDPQRKEQIIRWARFVRENPSWKKEHTAFIDSQFDMAQQFWKRLEKQPNGKEKLRKLYHIENPKAVPKWF